MCNHNGLPSADQGGRIDANSCTVCTSLAAMSRTSREALNSTWVTSLSVTASAYCILPRGPQQIFLRGRSTSGATKGGSLNREDRINLGVRLQSDALPRFECGLHPQLYSALNTFPLAIAVRMASLFRSHAGLRSMRIR